MQLITEGSRVIFRNPQEMEAPESQEWLRDHCQAYGPGPFEVYRRLPNHLVLVSPNTRKVMHFGSTADPAVNVGFFRRFDEQ